MQCPKCGSENVEWYSDAKLYLCHNCTITFSFKEGVLGKIEDKKQKCLGDYFGKT